MRIARGVAEMRELRAEHGTVGLVATMGALHEGTSSILRHARARVRPARDVAVRQPDPVRRRRDLAPTRAMSERDERLAAEAGVDVLFAPIGE